MKMNIEQLISYLRNSEYRDDVDHHLYQMFRHLSDCVAIDLSREKKALIVANLDLDNLTVTFEECGNE
jgi:hypothetical protein